MFQATPILLIGIFAGLLAAAAISDVRGFRIPNWISIAVAALFPLYVLSMHFWGPSGAEVRWLASLGIGAGVFTVLTALFAFGVMGGGDVKLIAAASLWAGPVLIAPFILVIALSGGIVAILAIILAKTSGKWRKHLDNHATKVDSVGETDYAETGAEILGQQVPLPIPYGVAIACGGFFISGIQIINHFNQ